MLLLTGRILRWIRIVIDGEEKKDTLFHLVQDTLKAHTTNSVIAFKVLYNWTFLALYDWATYH
jgi:hypothetical protein